MNLMIQASIRQDKEYKYRAFQAPNGMWQIERSEITPWQHNSFNGQQLVYWEYYGTVSTKEQADASVAEAKKKPNYVYY